MKRILSVALAIVMSAGLFAQGIPQKVKPVKNVIVMLTDGTSTSLFSTARWYQRYMTDSLTWSLNVDPYVCALMQSRLSNAIIPDSAPAMSGIITGVPSRQGNISIYPQPHPGQDVVKTNPERAFQPAATALEAAKLLKNKATGLAVTVIFPHATPAACASHLPSRGKYAKLAYQMASHDLDVVFGGGGKILTDEMRDIIRGNGATLLEDDLDGFKSFNGNKIWSIFGKDAMDYELDRNPETQPSLSEMTGKAIDVLSKNKNGFFLMVEGSKVDYAAHACDPIAVITEFLEFDKAVGVALDYAKKDGNTAVIILADHGTAGVTLGDRNYKQYSQKGLDSMFVNMKNYKATSGTIAAKINAGKSDEVSTIFKEWTGIDLKPGEKDILTQARGIAVGDYMQVSNSYNLQSEICKILASRTHLGFTSGNHTGEDVFLAVYNPNGQRPSGVVTNTELNSYMCSLIGGKKTLEQLSDECYSKADKVLAGFTLKPRKENDNATLTAKKGELTIKLYDGRSYATVIRGDKEETISLPTPTVYIPENKTFYIHTCLANVK